MKCTECRKTIRPVVAIDIDGTLGDYHGHFLTFAAAYLGLPEMFFKNNPYGGGQNFREWFTKVTQQPDSTWRDIKLAYRQGAQKRSMPFYPGATEMCHAIREAGAELWLTTTRPYLRLDNIDPDTREWLARMEIKYDGLLYDHLKYERLYEVVGEGRVVAVLDDLWYQCIQAEQEFGKVAILRRTPYNVRDRHSPSVETLDQATELIVNRVADWMIAHEFDDLETTNDSPRDVGDRQEQDSSGA